MITSFNNVPLAFNILPITKDNKIEFYIPSLSGSAILLKLECKNKEEFLSKIKENSKIKYYNKLPSLLECEGNDLIHLGVIDNSDLTLFITFDYLKCMAQSALKQIEKGLKDD